jgi:hypothetical protein
MIDEIRDRPTCLTPEQVKSDLKEKPSMSGWHESLLRSYHIVQKVKDMLELGTPPEVVLEIINDMEK